LIPAMPEGAGKRPHCLLPSGVDCLRDYESNP